MSIASRDLIQERLQQIEHDIRRLEQERHNLFEYVKRLDEWEIGATLVKRIFPEMPDEVIAKYVFQLHEVKLPFLSSKEGVTGPADLKKMSKAVCEFLQQKGEPIHLTDIALFLKDTFGYEVTVLTNSMKLMMKHNHKIKRSFRKGFYEVKE